MRLIPLRPFFGLACFSQYIEYIHLFKDKIQQDLPVSENTEVF